MGEDPHPTGVWNQIQGGDRASPPGAVGTGEFSGIDAQCA